MLGLSPLKQLARLDSAQMAGGARKKLPMTTYTIPKNTYLAKVAAK